MTALPLSIIRSAGLVTITTDDAMGLVIIEAARRDLNAMSQALGAGNDLRNRYAGYARSLSDAATSIPRVDLPTGKVVAEKTYDVTAVVQAIVDSGGPATRYFYHPESDCLMTTEDGTHPGTDGLLEEIDRETYERLQKRIVPDEDVLDVIAELLPTSATDDLDELLG